MSGSLSIAITRGSGPSMARAGMTAEVRTLEESHEQAAKDCGKADDQGEGELLQRETKA